MLIVNVSNIGIVCRSSDVFSRTVCLWWWHLYWVTATVWWSSRLRRPIRRTRMWSVSVFTARCYTERCYAQNPLRTFPHNFSVDGEAAKTCRLVADLLATRPTSPQQVGNNGIWETTRRNRHNGLLPTPTCYGLVVYVADFLWTCYGEVANFLRTCYGEMDFGLYATVCCPSVCPSVYLTVCDVHVRWSHGGRSVHHRSFHHRSIQHGRFITWTVHHTVNSTPDNSSQKLLYSAAIVFNISFTQTMWQIVIITGKMSMWLLCRKCPS